MFPPEMDGKGEYISPQICNRMKRDCLGRTKCSSILVLKGDSKPKRVFRSHRGRQTSDWNASGAMTTKNSKSRGNRVLSSPPRAIGQQQSAPFSAPRHHHGRLDLHSLSCAPRHSVRPSCLRVRSAKALGVLPAGTIYSLALVAMLQLTIEHCYLAKQMINPCKNSKSQESRSINLRREIRFDC